MSDFKITMNEALQLKETVQRKLLQNQFVFRNENSIPSDAKRSYNLKKLAKEDEDLRQKMVTLKLLIQEANLRIPEGETNVVSYYIFLLSERKRQIDNIRAMPTDEGSRILSDNNTIKYNCTFNNADKNDWLNKLNKEYREISNKLTKINSELIVSLPFNPSKI